MRSYTSFVSPTHPSSSSSPRHPGIVTRGGAGLLGGGRLRRMNIKPVAGLEGKTTTRGRQQTPRSLLDSLLPNFHFVAGPGNKQRGNLRAQQLDTNVRALVDECLFRSNA